MLISYQWLNEYVDLSDVTPDELADKMSRTGIEVEEVIRPDEGLKKIVVGEVLECVDHPNSDHLHICQVNIGDEVTQIVCGAPNVAAGQKVIVALPGARIAGNHKIKKSKMRGEASNGMLCALEEIGISASVTPKEYTDGIYILPNNAIPGESVFPLLGMDDSLLDMAITPNRADALSMRGTAYEVAAIYDKELSMKDVVLEEIADLTSDNIQAYVEDIQAAPVYTLRYIDHIKVQPSPMWLQNRLMNMGIRPVNNIVDITNYMMLEYGQPLHAYDASRLNAKNMVVRHAHEKEPFTTLDDEERTLSSEDIVIASDDKVVALAGVMGGKLTEVHDGTSAILLEAGQFDPISIRRTAKRHNLRTDASARFEKGINVAAIKEASNAAAQMIHTLAEGHVYRDMLIASDVEPEYRTLTITTDRINGLLGTQLSTDDMAHLFEALRFEVKVDGEQLTVTVPPRRWDISIDADLVEEIGRLYGYDNLPSTLPNGETAGQLSLQQKMMRRTKALLSGMGLQEAISYALTTEEKATSFVENKADVVKVDWPMSEEHAVLRQSIVQGLIDDITYNMSRQNSNLAFYETGTVFASQGKNAMPQERQHLGIALTGEWRTATWNQQAVSVDFFTAKGIVEAWLNDMALDATFVPTAEIAEMHPGRTAHIIVDNQVIGFVGQIHPEYEAKHDLPEIFVAEIDLTAAFEAPKMNQTFKPVSKYPAVTRDIALLVDECITNADLEKCLYDNGGRFLKQVRLFDLYDGEHVEQGKKSMAYQLTFVNDEATLTDDEIDQAMSKLTNKLIEQFQLTIR